MRFSLLYSLRLYRNWDSLFVSSQIHLSDDDYQRLEKGVLPIDKETAIKLSNLYQIPHHLFFIQEGHQTNNVIFSNCKFNDSYGYVNNLYKDQQELAAKAETIKLIKEEVNLLRKQNIVLLEMLQQQLLK